MHNTGRWPIGVVVGAVGLVTAAACSTAGDGSDEALAAAQGASLTWVIPQDMLVNPSQANAVAFAWQSFVGVNWPASAAQRGVPDQARLIGQQGPAVWQTWKRPEEVFYPDGRQPPQWNTDGDSLPAQCNGARLPIVLVRTSKVPGNSANREVQRAKEAVGGTLTDQHGNLVYFEVRMNRTIFDNIVANQYYNIEGQNKATSVLFPTGVMEIKAAWRILTATDAPVRYRYLRQAAWVYTPASGNDPATCVTEEVGLVGLHITQKTPSRPQWVWATFEHVDNVPPFNTSTPGSVPYSFNNPTCPPSQCVPNTSTERNGKPTGTPTQVTRVVNMSAEAQAANPAWQKRLSSVAGSPYPYYQLIDVQWPKAPTEPPNGNPVPGLLANTTMETYNGNTSSCVGCHFTAKIQSNKLSSDYSFLLAEAHSMAPGARR
jgi:hypothetical protein